MISFTLLVLTQGCRNLYRDFGDRSSDEFFIAQARIYLDELQFDEAIATIEQVLATQPNNEEVVYLTSAAYAGRAGLRILDLLAAIGTDVSTKGVIQIFAEHFPDADADAVADIATAVEILNTFEGDPAARSSRINFFMSFLLFSQIGVVNARYAFDGATTLNTDFTPCKSAVSGAGPTGIPDADVDTLIAAFGAIPDAIANSGSAAFSAISSSFSFTPPVAACAVTPASVECLLMRTLVGVGPTRSGIGFEILANPTVCLPGDL